MAMHSALRDKFLEEVKKLESKNVSTFDAIMTIKTRLNLSDSDVSKYMSEPLKTRLQEELSSRRMLKE